MNRCEDFPCCGHTNDDPCGAQWYDAPNAFDTTVNPHALCDHENGECDVYYDQDEECEPYHACDSCDGPRGTWTPEGFVPNEGAGWTCSYCDRPCPEGAHAD